jgi:type 1 glutamine amidotransferase
MHRKPLVFSLAVVLLLANICFILLSCGSVQSQTGIISTVSGGARMILVFAKTTGYRHASIKDGIAAIRKLAAEHQVGVDYSEDASIFTDASLAHYKAVVFLSTSGTLFNDDQRAAFERYIHAGGGYVGIHSASDTEYEWSWYGQLVGAYFKNHPHIQQATLKIEDHQHISTAKLPQQWVRTDEWYNFRSNPREHVHVLITLDESSYQGGNMGADHPISWYHDFDGGRAWYTGMGHTSETYQEPLFLQYLWGGIAYAANFSS